MKIFEKSTERSLGIIVATLIIFLVLFLVISTDQTLNFRSIGEFGKEIVQGRRARTPADTRDDSSQNSGMDKDILLGGLLAPGFDERSCLSRYQFALYRKNSPHKPSPYLISKLRNYEDLHQRCGPHTNAYNLTLEQLKSGKVGSSPTGCNYVVWAHHSGLGNRMLSMVSAFLYALLTNRVFVVEQTQDTASLFCEPFPNSSWMLPSGFPVRFEKLDGRHGNCFGNLAWRKMVNTSSAHWPPSFVYINLLHDYSYHDRLFFCNEYQAPLTNVPLLIIKSNLYFIPPLFTIPPFQQELDQLFPNKETVFHHLGRYLFHPTNQVWGLITRFYLAYLAKADQVVGIQIRVLGQGTNPLPYVMDQIMACTVKENILPALDTKEITSLSYRNSTKAVLVTSLYSGYFDHMRELYMTEPTVNMEVVGFHQPSHEEKQRFNNGMHFVKAWSEIYLLSMSDVLVTSACSTFGYVANGLGGLTPWILSKPENRTAPDPPCVRATSMEPCLHSPPRQNCTVRDQSDAASYLKPCEDKDFGIKLFNDKN